jgi:hypothetical protein
MGVTAFAQPGAETPEAGRSSQQNARDTTIPMREWAQARLADEACDSGVAPAKIKERKQA